MNGNGDRIAVSATGYGPLSGQVKIYQWSGTSWVQLGSDLLGVLTEEYFGQSISMNHSGDRIIIGASGDNANGSFSGSARVFEWNGTNWVLLGAKINGEAADDYSGGSVSMDSSGNRIAVGADLNDGNGAYAGHVRIYQWDGNNWVQLGIY